MASGGLTLFYNNDNLIQILGLVDELTGTFVNSATANCQIVDDQQNNIGSAVSLSYVANSNGNYQGIVPAATTNAMSVGVGYRAVITATVSAAQAQWQLPVVMQRRESPAN